MSDIYLNMSDLLGGGLSLANLVAHFRAELTIHELQFYKYHGTYRIIGTSIDAFESVNKEVEYVNVTKFYRKQKKLSNSKFT